MRPLAIVSLALVPPVLAQTNATVTLTVGNMVYTQSALSATSNTSVVASLTAQGAAGANHLFGN